MKFNLSPRGYKVWFKEHLYACVRDSVIHISDILLFTVVVVFIILSAQVAVLSCYMNARLSGRVSDSLSMFP
jgi:hypothetical protein